MFHAAAQPLRLWILTVLLLTSCGCSSNRQSNTARTATEQLLISNAVDQSLNKSDFTPLAGSSVFVEEKYIDCTDKAYVLGTIRAKLMQAGAVLAAKAEDADVIMEVRSGAVGTDVSSSYIGIPGFTAPGMIGIPDIKLITRDSQKATAKIGILVYDSKTRKELGEGGVATSMADDTNAFYFGIGPLQSGTLRNELDRSSGLKPGQRVRELPSDVLIAAPTPHKSAAEPDNSATVQLSSGEATSPAKPTGSKSKSEKTSETKE
jgi:hypothetical protein